MFCELLTQTLNTSIITAARLSEVEMIDIEKQLETKPHFSNYFRSIYNDFLIEIENCVNSYTADTYRVECQFIDYNVFRKTKIIRTSYFNESETIKVKNLFYELEIQLLMFNDNGTFIHEKKYEVNHEYN
jgi:hypothetical protein